MNQYSNKNKVPITRSNNYQLKDSYKLFLESLKTITKHTKFMRKTN